jgi:DNA-directed RNA polymerase specialized sigma24 family protein
LKNIIKDGTYWLAVWKGYLKGDEAAFREIYEEYIDPLFAYGCKLTKDREIVKDCIQDIFIDLQRLQPELRYPQ